MAIGTTAAILGSAIIGAGASAMSSKKNSKAINQATTAQQQSDAASIAAQERARAENTYNLSPFMQRGNAAGSTINALLGLGGSTTVSQGQQLPTQQALVPAQMGGFDGTMGGNTALQASKPWLFQGQGALTAYGQPGGQPQMTQQAGPQGQNPAQAAQSAYEIFKQSTGYTSRFNEGMRALEGNYFGGGVGQSGAAMKAALRYGQDYASNEFGKYLGYLGNQQGVGFAGASALAGVSQGFADRMSDISQNSANMAGQAAVARAQNNGALWGGLAGIAGQTAGALSSYRPPINYNSAALVPATSTMPMTGTYARAF